MSSGRKRKAQVTSFNSGVGTLGWDLGIWWGCQAWGVGLKGTQVARSLIPVGDLDLWYLKPLRKDCSVSRILQCLEPCA